MLDNFGNVCYGCIYKITNLINRKCYIGQTTQEYSMYIQKHFKNALNGHSKSKHFYNALRKYGKKNFKWKILGFCYSLEELDLAEIESIWLFRSYGSDGENYDIIYGYNHTIGGRGLIDLIHSEEWKTNHSNMMVGENNPMFGTNGFYGKWVEEYGLEIADEMQKELYEKRDEKIRNRSEEEKQNFIQKMLETKENKTNEEKKITSLKMSESQKERQKIYPVINNYYIWLKKFGEEVANQKLEEMNTKRLETNINKTEEEKRITSDKMRKWQKGEKNKWFGTNGFYGKWVEEYGLEIADEMQKELYEKRDEKIRNRSEEEKNITKLKQKETWKNKTKEEKQKTFNKRSKSSSGKNNPRAKKYILINPEGEEIFLHGEFYKFCEIHNLSRHCLKRVAKGELTNWKGWKCINVTNK